MIDLYRKHRECNVQDGSFVFDFNKEVIIQDYDYWVIITNMFPYDVITDTHHLLVPKRFFGTPKEINTVEREELESIKEGLADRYDGMYENLAHKRTIPAHFHIHLFLWKHTDDTASNF